MERFRRLRSAPGVLLARNWSAALSTAVCAATKDHEKGGKRERKGGRKAGSVLNLQLFFLLTIQL